MKRVIVNLNAAKPMLFEPAQRVHTEENKYILFSKDLF